MKKTLYVHRPLLNGEDLAEWAKSSGFKTTIDPSEMHVTIAFSKEQVEWDQFKPNNNIIRVEKGERSVKQFDGGATVLVFESKMLNDRWNEFKSGGASWDWPEYHSHVTISYNAGNLNVNKIEPYTGMLRFGPEIFKEVDLNWKNRIEEK